MRAKSSSADILRRASFALPCFLKTCQDRLEALLHFDNHDRSAMACRTVAVDSSNKKAHRTLAHQVGKRKT